uniref:hypothetical protein n=1 Tax=Frisingicoccus sp. TaxID=1918627 RepID=UPI0025BBCCC5
VWISRKHYNYLNKRIADLEKQLQSQHITLGLNVILKDGSLFLYPRRKNLEYGVKDNNLEGQQNV